MIRRTLNFYLLWGLGELFRVDTTDPVSIVQPGPFYLFTLSSSTVASTLWFKAAAQTPAITLESYLLFIYFWPCLVFIVTSRLCIVAVRGVSGASPVAEHPALGTQAQRLWCMGLVAPSHVGSSWTGDQTCVPCTGRWILNHWATREAPVITFLF